MGVLVGAALLAACQPLDDPQPPVASVDFEARLVVTVGPDGLTAEAGPRDGARLDGPDEGTVPKGSVVELHDAAGEGRRIVITRSALDSADPGAGDVWLDTGTMLDGETTVLGLSAVGTYTFTVAGSAGTGTSDLTIHVVA
jgi:hypothetical protein